MEWELVGWRDIGLEGLEGGGRSGWEGGGGVKPNTESM